MKEVLAQHSPLQHFTVLLQQKPPQQVCEVEEQGLVLEQDVTELRAAGSVFGTVINVGMHNPLRHRASALNSMQIIPY